jgi:methylmalonyl-CoA mutase, N-terminal domain
MADDPITVSGFPLEASTAPSTSPASTPRSGSASPGAYPYTRGVYPTMYRGRPWTMRQYAGFSTAEESNLRYKYLLEQGTTGLSVAFDLPTQMGYDSSAEIADGEVGKVGVAIDTVEDMKALFDGIPLDQVSTSMTINAPASLLLLMYQIAGEEQGVDPAKLRGTIQNDVLKEYIARGTYIYPPAASLRIIADTFAYCTEHLPRFNTISISGYHMGEAGATPVQEIAFTLADGIAYVQAAIDAGLDVDAFAPRLSFFFVARSTLLEEVAKFRAARRLWASIMRDRFGAQDPKSQMLRFHTQTAGVQLTAQQPEVNLVRVAIQALAATLGGTQSLHTNSFDEALALPTEKSARLALRTQQVIAHETDVPPTVDPLAGSYLIESLTDRIEQEARGYLDRIDELGGAVQGDRGGLPEGGDRARGLRRGQADRRRGAGRRRGQPLPAGGGGRPARPHPHRRGDPGGQIERIDRVKRDRDQAGVDAALAELAAAAKGDANLLVPMREALRRRATLQEVCDVLRAEYGGYVPRDVFCARSGRLSRSSRDGVVLEPRRHRLRGRDQARQRPDHDPEPDDATVLVEREVVEPLDVLVADPGGEDQRDAVGRRAARRCRSAPRAWPSRGGAGARPPACRGRGGAPPGSGTRRRRAAGRTRPPRRRPRRPAGRGVGPWRSASRRRLRPPASVVGSRAAPGSRPGDRDGAPAARRDRPVRCAARRPRPREEPA